MCGGVLCVVYAREGVCLWLIGGVCVVCLLINLCI